jgi:hypothetical protein
MDDVAGLLISSRFQPLPCTLFIARFLHLGDDVDLGSNLIKLQNVA